MLARLRLLFRLLFVAGIFGSALLIGLYVLGVSMVGRNRDWPAIHSAEFELTPGAEGSWELAWPPAPNRWEPAEFRLVVDPEVDPAAVDVLLLAEPATYLMHARESIGVVSSWVLSGTAWLPAEVHRPLLVSGPSVQRVSWVVMRVGPTAFGTTAHIVLAQHEDQQKLHEERARSPAVAFLPTVLLLAIAAIGIGIRLHRVGTRKRAASTREVALEGLGGVGILLIATVVGVSISIAGLQRSWADRVGEHSSWGGCSSSTPFTLNPGASGTWIPEPPERTHDGRRALLWLGTDFMRERPDEGDIDVLVRADPPDSAWSFEPGRESQPDDWWRVGLEEDFRAALVVDLARLRSIAWRVESTAPTWNGGGAWIEAWRDRDAREPTDGATRVRPVWSSYLPSGILGGLAALGAWVIWRCRRKAPSPASK